jgi:hypothetical protein
MKKAITLIFASLCLHINSYAGCKTDSIYLDLYSFLVSKGSMPKESVPEFGSENYAEFIYIFDVLGDDFPNKPDLDVKLGIYKFNYIGCIDCGYYVLIKYENSYKVYNQESLSLIIEELFRIQKKKPKLLPNKLFYKYLSELIKVDLGIYEKKTLVQQIGKIEYYR